MDFKQARFNMVEGQIRTNKVTDHRLIEVLKEIPREVFVSREQQSLAYVDDDLPLQFGQSTRYLMEPMIFARLVQSAQLKKGERVLEVGCLTGYQAAVLSRLGAEVVALDSNTYALNRAKEIYEKLGIKNVELVREEFTGGHPAGAPYDCIIISGAVNEVPPSLFDQLAEGGRLLAVTDATAGYVDNTIGKACLWQKNSKNLTMRQLFDAQVKCLPGFEKKPTFQF